MKILIIEDETLLAESVAAMLRSRGYEVETAFDGDTGLEYAKLGIYDLVILDVMLPGMDGCEVCKKLREKDRLMGIIMLTARTQEREKVSGLQQGADDYVTKPFSPKEVMARINAVTKRRTQKQNGNEILKFEGLEIDMAGRNVYVDGEKAELTPKEYELLFYLVRNKGIALTREKLLYDVWGFDFYGDDRTVDTHIKMLRSNLKDYRKFIVTLRGLGYKFES